MGTFIVMNFIPTVQAMWVQSWAKRWVAEHRLCEQISTKRSFNKLKKLMVLTKQYARCQKKTIPTNKWRAVAQLEDSSCSVVQNTVNVDRDVGHHNKNSTIGRFTRRVQSSCPRVLGFSKGGRVRCQQQPSSQLYANQYSSVDARHATTFCTTKRAFIYVVSSK